MRQHRHALAPAGGTPRLGRAPLPLAALAVAGAVILAGGATGHDAGPPRSTSGAASDDTRLAITGLLEDLLDEIDGEQGPQLALGGDEIPLATLKFFIELNEADEDVGIQCVLGGEPYKRLRAFAPDGKMILDLKPRRALRQQGMSDFFFESAEPSLEEFSMADFLDRFPEGIYEFETRTIEGDEQDGEAILTHAMPAGPVITGPEEGDVVDPADLTVTWEPVTMSTSLNPPQVPVTIVGYQVILTREDPLRVFSVDMPADATSVSVPPEFLDPGVEYELEILAVEESDNQTISIVFFETAEE